jgi:hypothetical protein
MKLAAKALANTLLEHPDATVIERPRNGVKFDLGNGQTRAVFGVGEGYHLANGTEIDTAWTPTTEDGFQWRMVLADYRAHVKNTLNWGDLIRFTHPESGHWVIFDPQSLNWVNADYSRQYLTGKQGVAATPGQGDDDDLLTWTNGWGTGKHFSYRCAPQQLVKLITIDSAANIPAPEAWMTGTLHFEIEFVLKHSTGLRLWLDGAQWTKQEGARVKTSGAIEFKDAGGVTLFYLARPFATDANGDEAQVEYEVRRQSNDYFCTVRVPKTWIDTAIFPIQIDPTFSTSVAASADDAFQASNGDMTLNGTTILLDAATEWGGVRFTNVTIANGATISSATITVNVVNTSTDDPDELLFMEAIDDAPAFGSGNSNISNRTMTSSPVTWQATGVGSGSETSPNFASVAQQVIDRAGWASGNDVVVILDHQSTSVFRFTTYDNGSNYPSISIDYTEAGGTEYTQDVSGTLTSSGAVFRDTSKSFAGTLTSAGVLLRQANKTLAGTLSSAGALLRQANKNLAGVLTSAGALARETAKALAGTLTSSGDLTSVRTFLKVLEGTLTSAGTLTRQAGKSLSGTLASSGDLLRSTAKTLAGTLASAGSLTRETAKSFAGTLTSSGALTQVRTFLKALEGTLTSAGVLTRQTEKGLTGTLTSSGALSRSISKALSGTLTSAGALSRSIGKTLSGVLTSAGALATQLTQGGAVTAIINLTARARSFALTAKERVFSLTVRDRD